MHEEQPSGKMPEAHAVLLAFVGEGRVQAVLVNHCLTAAM